MCVCACVSVCVRVCVCVCVCVFNIFLLRFLIVVGDEILKGHVQDANSHYLCRQLWLCSVRVCKV